MLELLAKSPSTPVSLRGCSLWGWWDFTDINSLYVEEDFTTPVANDLDEIGAVLDKSGNGRHLTQGTSTARALYRTSQVNRLSAAAFGSSGSGAVDDYYDISNPGILNANWTILVTSVVNTAASKAILGSANNGWREFFDGSELYTGGKTSVANVYASSVGLTAAAWSVVYAMYEGSDRAHIEFAGVNRSPTNNSVTGQVMTVNTALFGALTGPGSFYDGFIAECIKGGGRYGYEAMKHILRSYISPKYNLAA